MYQIGVLLVWLQNRTKRSRQVQPSSAPAKMANQPTPINRPLAHPIASQPAPATPRPINRTRPVMDIASPRIRTTRPARPVQADVIRQAPKLQPVVRPEQRLRKRPNSIDGMVPRNQQLPQAG
jgi:hypothetical protein